MTARKFQVVVIDRKLIYPPQEGEQALRCMRVLAGRGYDTEALTTANGIDESLPLAEMETIYDSERQWDHQCSLCTRTETTSDAPPSDPSIPYLCSRCAKNLNREN